jgi:hypothetical protein
VAKSRTSYAAGRSGNPGGRPRAALDVQELARSKTTEAIEALTAALHSPRERVQAACALLDRGWGRPALRVGGDGDGPPIHYTFEWAPATPQPQGDAPTIDGQPAGEAERRLELVWEAGPEPDEVEADEPPVRWRGE